MEDNLCLFLSINSVAYKPNSRPPLNGDQKAARRKFAKRILDLIESDASSEEKFIFSDEKLFRGVPCNQAVWVRREKGEAWKEEDIHPNKNSKATVMVWVYVGAFGKGDVFLAENRRLWDEFGNPIKQTEPDDGVTGFDNKSYVELIEKQGLPSIRSRVSEFVFVQDNCRVHTSTKKNPGNTIYDVFERNEVEFINDWPANSPDLHPVENALKFLADEVNKELDKLLKQPKNKHELFALVKACWDRVSDQHVKNSYYSFAKRLKLCLIHGGANNFATSTKLLKNRKLLETFNLSHYDVNGDLLDSV